MQFFVMKSASLAHIQTSVRVGVWATSGPNTETLMEALDKSDHVVLLFSANQTGHFQGYARMASEPDAALQPGLWGKASDRLGHTFKVTWLKQCMLPFSQLESLRDGLSGDSPLWKSRDGQEVPATLGEKLVRLLYQQRTEDLLSLPADDDESDLFRTASRSRSPQCRSSGKGALSRSGSRKRRHLSQSSHLQSQDQHKGGRLVQDASRAGLGESPSGAWIPPSGAPAPRTVADGQVLSAVGGSSGSTTAGLVDASTSPGEGEGSAVPAWTKKPASMWMLPNNAGQPLAADTPQPGVHPAHGLPPGWGGPYGPPPGWGFYPPPPGAFGIPAWPPGTQPMPPPVQEQVTSDRPSHHKRRRRSPKNAR